MGPGWNSGAKSAAGMAPEPRGARGRARGVPRPGGRAEADGAWNGSETRESGWSGSRVWPTGTTLELEPQADAEQPVLAEDVRVVHREELVAAVAVGVLQ